MTHAVEVRTTFTVKRPGGQTERRPIPDVSIEAAKRANEAARGFSDRWGPEATVDVVGSCESYVDGTVLGVDGPEPYHISLKRVVGPDWWFSPPNEYATIEEAAQAVREALSQGGRGVGAWQPGATGSSIFTESVFERKGTQ